MQGRLRTIDPDAMADYDQARTAGVDRMTAMGVTSSRSGRRSRRRRGGFSWERRRRDRTVSASDAQAEAVVTGAQIAADIAGDNYVDGCTTVASPQRFAAELRPQ